MKPYRSPGVSLAQRVPDKDTHSGVLAPVVPIGNTVLSSTTG